MQQYDPVLDWYTSLCTNTNNNTTNLDNSIDLSTIQHDTEDLVTNDKNTIRQNNINNTKATTTIHQNYNMLVSYNTLYLRMLMKFINYIKSHYNHIVFGNHGVYLNFHQNSKNQQDQHQYGESNASNAVSGTESDYINQHYNNK
eukprot:UN06769